MNTFATPPAEVATASNPSPVANTQLADTGNALRAIIFKEVRPNLAYALAIVGMIALIAMIPSVTNMLRPVPLAPTHENALSSYDFNVGLWPICAVIGLLMGAIQARSSRTPDAWAFTIHRPISRGKLYLGKWLGAAILYGIAAGLPILGLLLDAGLSRTYPYHWRYNFPAIAAAIGGFLFCIAGLLIMERKAFILGSAAVPFVTAAVALVIAALMPTFALAMTILVAFGAILTIAGWGAHASDGYALHGPWFTRAAMALVLMIGFTMLLGVPSQVMKQGMRSISPPPIANSPFGGVSGGSNVPAGQRISLITTYLFLPDGTLGRRALEYKGGTPPGSVEYVDTYVHVDPPSAEWDADSIMKDLERLGERTSAFHRPPPPPTYADVEGLNDPVYAPDGNGEAWYYIRTAGVLRGYNRPTGMWLGTIGAQGWVPPGEPGAIPFRRWNTDGRIFVGPRGLYEIDFLKRSSKLRLETPADEMVEGWCYVLGEPAGVPVGPVAGEVFIAALTSTHVYIGGEGDSKPRVVLSTAAVMAGPGEASITRFVAAKRWGVRSGVGPERNSNRRPATFQVFVDAGKLVWEKTVPQGLAIIPEPLPALYTEELTPMAAYAGGFFDAMSNLPAVWAVSEIARHLPIPQRPSNGQQFFEPRANTWYLVPAAEVALISALFALLFGRVCAVRRMWLWMLLAIICGPAVVLVMISTHQIQKSTACPSCGKSRYVFTEKCPRCGAEFPPPVVNATEIFAA